ncbi:hypothetical protein VIGAN_09218300 [Vigna angularis var. angularis]|uniref:Uncharacterized protein n=2 Tax=Phaseolus angularis TaxID=3914 RepID=A0A0S3T0F5_PHAAN|nr:hypothetical protein VIGAN_09218300 [Vigna angularis var. angularis]
MHFKHLGPLNHFVLPRFSSLSVLLVLYTMNLENCHCLSTISNSSWQSYERIGYDPIVCVNEFVTRLKMGSWKALWRKIKRERRRFFRPSPVFHVQYDPTSYLHNFDDGYSTDPDNVSRSFSARFAAPSKILAKIQMGHEDLEINHKSNIM